MLSVILAGTALFIAICALILSWYAYKYTRQKSVRAISLRRMMKMEAEMTDITDMISSLRTSMHKLRSRIQMRDRNSGNSLPNDDNEPTDPEEWYRWARKKYLPSVKKET